MTCCARFCGSSQRSGEVVIRLHYGACPHGAAIAAPGPPRLCLTVARPCVSGVATCRKALDEFVARRSLSVSTSALANMCHICCIAWCAVLQVSPDENFEDIVGVTDTFVPAANVWVGEYPYLEKASGTYATIVGHTLAWLGRCGGNLYQ